jgi:hypothetical protein
MCTSGRLVLLDAGSETGEVAKAVEPTGPSHVVSLLWPAVRTSAGPRGERSEPHNQ